MDQVDQKAGNSLARAPGVTTSQQQDAQQMSANLQAGVTCYTTDCGSTCKKGTNPVAQMNGQPGQLSTNSRCANNKYHTLCCDDGTFMGTCRWRGYRGVGLSCISGCADGETEVVTDTNHHDKNGDQSCTGGLQSYCCKGFKPIPSKGGLKSKAEDAAKAAAEAAAENAVLDVAAKAFCRVAVPALLAPLELLEDLIPIVGKSRTSNASPSCKLIWLVGEILDLAEIAATPALIDVCVKGVEKEGKAEFKVFGKKHSLNFNKPTEKPSATRPPKSSHTPAKTSQNSCEIPKKAKRAGDGDCNDRRRKKPMRMTTSIEDHADPPTDIFCDYALYGQACLHYNSVIHHNAGYGIITCPYSSQGADRRPIVAVYNQERKEGWIAKIPAFNGGKGCERDEWPPAHLHEANNGYLKLEGSGGRPSNPRQQYVRLINGDENGNAGQLWKSCPKVAQRNDIDAETSTEHGAGRIDTVWTKVKAVYTRKAFSMRFRNLVNPDGDDGLQLNQCQPEQLNANGNRFDHRGFALLNEDSWFDRNPNAKQYTAAYGQAPNFKRRDLDWLDPDQISVVDANSTRKATDKELRHDFGLIRCTDQECSQELADLNIKSALRYASPQSTPIDVPATATATTPSDVMAATATAAGLIAQNPPSLPGHEVSSAEFPRRTWVP
jgi:chitinase